MPDLIQIDSVHVQGEPGTGFEKRGNKGPFECGNCEYFDGQSCGQKTMMERSRQPKLPSGRIRVDADDCCEYVERRGKTRGVGRHFGKLSYR